MQLASYQCQTQSISNPTFRRRLDKLNDMKYMTPTGTHSDGGPFGISLESLAAQGVSLEMGALRAVIQKQ